VDFKSSGFSFFLYVESRSKKKKRHDYTWGTIWKGTDQWEGVGREEGDEGEYKMS
jgi:hypothetical protein